MASTPTEDANNNYPIQPAGLTTPQKTLVKAWWKKVIATTKVENKLVASSDKSVFGLPLTQSIQYAYSTISYYDETNNAPCLAIIPTIIAKCGSYLKEQGLEVEGIFRLSGSAKRIGQLQALFDTPETQYGVYLGWDDYNVHDAANVMRRFLNHLPEPVIPLNNYQLFKTTMASVFAPGILSHPDDALNPSGYKESQLVLEYLIEHQDKFRMPSSRIPFVKEDCHIRPPLQAPVMQQSMSSPAEMLFTTNTNNVHPLCSTGTASSSPSNLDTKSMISLPLPTASSPISTDPSSSSTFYNNRPSSKSLVQVGQQPTRNDPIFPIPITPSTSTPSTSIASTGIRRNKTLPSKRSLVLSTASTSSPSLPSTSRLYSSSTSNNKQPSWLERSTSTSIIRRERQQSMPMTNQKPPVRRWKSIRTVSTMERDDLTTPIFTQ
ncbi:Rho GTPase activation protein [Chlamydoabsidia padenii]|nr:Rho GTPase activation protein [Chlamydoabsidia padenii]